MPRHSFMPPSAAALLIAAAISGLPMTPTAGAHFSAEEASKESVVPAGGEDTAATARVWKSETTGNEYRVHIEGDVLQAEWINIPAQLRGNGAFVRTECRRVGTRWIGTTRSRLRLPCTEVTTPDGHHPSAWCSLVTRTEINTVSPDRITGRAQAPTRLDCQACKLLDAEWKDFTWTPRSGK